MSDYFEIGKIVNTQGIKGDVRVVPTTDDIKRFELLETVGVRLKEILNYSIERVWYNKSFVILKFKEIPDMTAAEKLKGGVIVIPPEKALPLGEDEFYIKQLYGMPVETSGGEFLGEITDILQTGANDVYVVKNAADGTEILIPAIKQCILQVDTSAKKMTVNLLEGLR